MHAERSTEVIGLQLTKVQTGQEAEHVQIGASCQKTYKSIFEVLPDAFIHAYFPSVTSIENVHCVKLHHSFNILVRPIVFRTLDFSFGTTPFNLTERLFRTLNPRSLVSSNRHHAPICTHCSTHLLDQAISFIFICPHL